MSLQCKESICLFIRRMMNQIAIVIEAWHCYKLYTEFYPTFFSQVYLCMQQNYGGSSLLILI